MKRYFLPLVALAGMATAFSGCASLNCPSKNEAPANSWYLDPATEMVNYKTYAFLQVTAARYQDPVDTVYRRSMWEKMRGKKKTANRPEIHHIDEIVWRTIQGEMDRKGYHQVAPDKADLWVAYYGGPRPSTPPADLKVNGGSFDTYFAANELHDDTFFVDVIDAKNKTLIYRGWNNKTFHKTPFPDADRVMGCATDTLSFFPSKR